ncbi:phage Gp37/Gp68 family protein [Parvularcula sp. ZS-1/3]|uniref:Phage Gp37/Gp68 family protein n=1 Tax=Parvularcula mediterranea TaxID=2732508 RepID=A0A7Y3RN17_9PROT|nr:phage Gp37/Gp68 family protein [Parvularcula mediterranea]
MVGKSHIEWTEMTWNPVTGCTKVSPGCKFCYAESLAKRLKAMGANGYDNGFQVSLLPERLDQPRRRKTPTMWFVNSMSDLFHDKVPFAYVERVMETITETPQHIYQILTKRPKRMAKFFARRTVPENAWLGVTVEDRKYGVPRISVLKGVPAKTRFLSVEPLLEDVGNLDLEGIHWVIVGGESGSKARPMEAEWARSVRDQCARDNVAFFFKQWGSHGDDGVRRAKSANGRELDGQTHDEMPLTG